MCFMVFIRSGCSASSACEFQNKWAVLTILAQKLNNFPLFTQGISKHLLPWVELGLHLSHFLLKS